MKIGSLFSGYGGLDMGVQAVLGGEVAWHVEFDPAPSKILAHHWPDVPNYGDVTTVRWTPPCEGCGSATVLERNGAKTYQCTPCQRLWPVDYLRTTDVPEPVDILTGGFPCQDVSLAGRRAGMREGTRSGLWSEFARAIDQLRPGMVVIENVRGLLSADAHSDVEPCPWCVGDGTDQPVLRALGAVLGDLADLGYDSEWCGVRAADAGAPHGRFRVFIVAYPTHLGHERGWSTRDRWTRLADGGGVTANSIGGELQRRRGLGELEATTSASEGVGWERQWVRDAADGSGQIDHGPVIRQWERKLGRPAPQPTEADGRNGQHRLSARFAEWMMGLPEGHVTDPAIGITRNEQMKALGNGVVPQQAELALRLLLSRQPTLPHEHSRATG